MILSVEDDIVARLRAIPTVWPLVDEAADEIERLRGELATRFVSALARENKQLRKELAARCGDGGAGAHTAGPTEHFIPEAL